MSLKPPSAPQPPPFTEAVALFNWRNRLQLTLADPASAGIPISGLFPSDDPETFSRLVVASAGLQAARRTARLSYGVEGKGDGKIRRRCKQNGPSVR